jgi:hypothetical protein
MTKLYLEVRMKDEAGRTIAVVCNDLPREAAYMGKRIVDEMKLGVYWDPSKPSPLEAVVSVLHVREFRRDLLARAAQTAGYQIADFLADREGWNGADRSEACERRVLEDNGG